MISAKFSKKPNFVFLNKKKIPGKLPTLVYNCCLLLEGTVYNFVHKGGQFSRLRPAARLLVSVL